MISRFKIASLIFILVGTFAIPAGDAASKELSGVVRIDIRPPPDDEFFPPSQSLRVLTFNIFMRPTLLFPRDDQDARAKLIPGEVSGYDAIIFQEAFSDLHREQILGSIQSEYPYQTRILGKDRALEQDGGVVIVSKWPIERQFQMLYEDLCTGVDCLADKGVLYARLNVNGKPVHIFGTHTQAGDDQRPTREAQLINIKWLIDTMSIPSDQLVLIAGDLNVDLYDDVQYKSMLRILEAMHPLPGSGNPMDYGYTSDPETNTLANPDDPQKYLDYVFYSNVHYIPDRSSNDVQILKVDGKDLSDHYSVEGDFLFSSLDTAPTDFPFAVLYGSNVAEENYVCNVSMEREKLLDFTEHRECVDDEVRSLTLYDVPAGSVLRLYDSSDGSRDDDWMEIIVKSRISKRYLNTLEQSFEDAYLRVTYFSHNGLDGKVSRLETGICSGDCGAPVSIVTPKDGAIVPAGKDLTVNVWTRTGASDVQLSVDGIAQQLDSFDNESTWSFTWSVPSQADREYQLQASTLIDGTQFFSEATVTAKFVNDVSFQYPMDGASIPINVDSLVLVNAPPTTGSVDLQFTPSEGHPVVSMRRNAATGQWEYLWRPQAVGGHALRAVAYDIDNVIIDDATIHVTAEDGSGAFLWIDVLGVVFLGKELTVTVNAPSATNVTLSANGIGLGFKGQTGSDWHFSWNPGEAGDYTLEARAQYTSGPAQSAFKDVRVENPPRVDIEVINDYSFLGILSDLKPGRFATSAKFPTGISSEQYACGVVGYAATGGDIGERVIDDGFYPIPDIIRVQLTPEAGTWNLSAWFHTLHASGRIFPTYSEDRPETWDVQILCISKEIAFVQPMPNLGDNLDYDTGISYDAYACGIAGFWAKDGDINENNTHDIFQMYLKRKNENWWIQADFVTHKGRNENWDIDLLCISRNMAALDGPTSDTQFFFREYYNLGDNIGIDRQFDTKISVDDYVCGVAGFAALDGDIDEHDKNSDTNLFSVYMYPSGPTWRIRADFRTHKNDETWNVNVLCAARPPIPPGASQPPEITSAPVFIVADWQEEVAFTVTASDPNADEELRIIVDDLPVGAVFSTTTGTGVVAGQFRWSPRISDLGYHTMTFTAEDELGERSEPKTTTIFVCDGEIDCY